MRVVLDTNVLLISIPRKSKYRKIFDAYLSGKLTLIITTAIFFEYIEIIAQQSKKEVAQYIEDSLVAAKNVEISNVYYNWQLITVD